MSFVSTVEEYKTAHARYWSICFGSARDTHSYYSVYDKQAAVPDGEACPARQELGILHLVHDTYALR